MLLSGLQQKKITQNYCPGFDMSIKKKLCPFTTADTRLGCTNEKPLSLNDEISLQFWLSKPFLGCDSPFAPRVTAQLLPLGNVRL